MKKRKNIIIAAVVSLVIAAASTYIIIFRRKKRGSAEVTSLYHVVDYVVGSEAADQPDENGFCHLGNILFRKNVARWMFDEVNPKLENLTTVASGLTIHLPYIQ